MEVTVNDSIFKQEVLKSDIPVLVDYWAQWCGPCKMIAPTITDIAKKYKGRLKVCKINVDESPKTAANYGLRSIPTLSIFQHGKVMEQIVGVNRVYHGHYLWLEAPQGEHDDYPVATAMARMASEEKSQLMTVASINL